MKKLHVIVMAAGLVSLFFNGCLWTGNKSAKTGADSLKVSIMKEKYGTCDDKPVYLFTMKNGHGITVKITNYGGIITSIMVPDKKGKSGDIVLGYDSLSQYRAKSPYFGAIVGRYANRIANGRF